MSPGSDEILVDRLTEMDLISKRLEGAGAGHGCCIAISGEPGIGKTRLAQAATAAARAKGFGVYWSQCHDGQYIPPYWPWKQLVRELIKNLPSRSPSPGRAIVSVLSEIVPDAASPGPSAARTGRPSPEQMRLKILESVTELLRLVSKRSPLLLIIDNLHCADVPSLQLLQVICREMSQSPVAVIGSYREPSAEAPSALRETIGALAGQAFFENIALSGWDLAGVRECLGLYGAPNAPDQLAEAVHKRTDGNPLFVLEVARLLQHDGLLTPGQVPAARAWETHIPSKIRLVILGLFERLTGPCRDTLAAASIIGREWDSALLRQILQVDDPALTSFLEEALAHGLIEEVHQRAGRYRFSHALVQDVVREKIPGPRRSVLHLRTATALEHRYRETLEEHAGELARHFDAAGSEHVDRAVGYYKAAGERGLRMCGYEDAYEQLSRAIELGREKMRPAHLAPLLFGLAQAQHGLGQVVPAAVLHERAFDLFLQEGDIDSAARIFEQPLILMEKPARLRRQIEKVIGLVGPSSLRGEALGGKYGLALYHDTGDYPRAASIFERAAESARIAGDGHQEISALINWGRIEVDELHYEKALGLEEKGLRLAMETGDRWLEVVARATLILALVGLGRLGKAKAQAAALFETAQRMQTRLWVALAPGMQTAVIRQAAELQTACESVDRALSLGSVPYRTWNLSDRALLDYETGSPADGAERLRLVLAEAERAEFVFRWEGSLAVLIPYIGWITGEPVPLAAAEDAARKVPAAGGMRRGDALTLSVGRALIAALRGEREAAALHYDEILPYRGLVACPYLGLTADHLLAVLASTMGQPELARAHFEAALAFCRSHELLLELAYTCRDYAEFLDGTSTRADVQVIADLCEEAGSIAARAGAPFLARRIDRVSAAARARKPSRRDYPESLSEREVEVLRLIAEGLSNAQIGTRLFISLHTVANHVQSILQKTRAANRTEAAAYAIRHRLSDLDGPAGSQFYPPGTPRPGAPKNDQPG